LEIICRIFTFNVKLSTSLFLQSVSHMLHLV